MGTLRTDAATILTDLPLLLWRNVVTSTNVAAEEDPDFPASNVANPSTSLKWKHDATDSPENTIEYFRVDVSAADSVSYIAIAGHNFNTAGIAVGLEIATSGSPVGGGEGIFEPLVPTDDGPIIFVFSETEVEELRIILVTGSAPAEIAVVYAGVHTVLPEGIQPTHTPLPLASVAESVTGMSESGQFLGRITLSRQLVSSATIENFSKAWARSELVPFLDSADDYPFFWAWSPLTYPDETAFAWLANDAQPVFDVDGYGSVTLDMQGVAT
jgi:hypothetical protein